MRKKITASIAVSFGLVLFISITNAFLSYRIDRTAGTEFGNYFQYSGAIHIHTRYSDGGATYERIGHIADSLGLHFIIPSDHNTVQPHLDGMEKKIGGTLIIPAVEISTNDSHGHFLVIGDSIPLVPRGGITSDAVFNDARAKGNMTFLAHVYHPIDRLNWDNWKIGDFHGIELFNLDSNWRRTLSPFRLHRLLSAFAVYYIHDEVLNHLITYPRNEMKTFDELNSQRKVVGIGSLDAHSRIRILRGNREKGTDGLIWHFPSYESNFNLVNTIIVTREPFDSSYDHDKRLLLHAIRQGNSYVGFSGLENARGFLFTASSDTEEIIMGERLYFGESGEPIRLTISMPDSNDVLVQLIRNGAVFREFRNVGTVQVPVSEPGVYRVQAFQHRIMLPFFMKRAYPWILSNPIYLFN